jgi:hypothetical protein
VRPEAKARALPSAATPYDRTILAVRKQPRLFTRLTDENGRAPGIQTAWRLLRTHPRQQGGPEEGSVHREARRESVVNGC